MLDIVDRIVLFEEMLQTGQSLTREEKTEKKALEPLARALKKIQAKQA